MTFNNICLDPAASKSEHFDYSEGRSRSIHNVFGIMELILKYLLLGLFKKSSHCISLGVPALGANGRRGG